MTHRFWIAKYATSPTFPTGKGRGSNIKRTKMFLNVDAEMNSELCKPSLIEIEFLLEKKVIM